MLPKDYKVALVTGASSGIGAATSKRLCMANVKVVAIARDHKKLKAVQQSLPKSKQQLFIALPKDLTKLSDLNDILRYCEQKAHIDLLINNAGIGIDEAFVNITDKKIKQIFATNVFGHAYITRGLLKRRLVDRPLRIVFVSSLAGKIGFPGLSAYTASKFAIEGLAESLQQEYQGTPVTITTLRPGITDTNFFKTAKMHSFRNSAVKNNLMSSPEHVATELLRKLPGKPRVITIGNDRYYLKILTYLPFKYRLKVLNITNKLGVGNAQ